MSYRFRNVNSRMSQQDIVNMINSNFKVLDREAVTKTYKQAAGKTAQITGRLPNGKYGSLYYDSNGKARILIGQAPDDGRMGIWVSKEGIDVLVALGGGGDG